MVTWLKGKAHPDNTCNCLSPHMPCLLPPTLTTCNYAHLSYIPIIEEEEEEEKKKRRRRNLSRTPHTSVYTTSGHSSLDSAITNNPSNLHMVVVVVVSG